jgi:hypothetical protein
MKGLVFRKVLGKCVVLRESCFITLLVCGFSANVFAQIPEPPTLRPRVQAFTKLLWSEQWDQALKFVDPEVIATKGRDAVIENYRQTVLTRIQRPNTMGAGFAITKVEVAPNGAAATVLVGFLLMDTRPRAKKETIGVPIEQRWVYKNREWFATP